MQKSILSILVGTLLLSGCGGSGGSGSNGDGGTTPSVKTLKGKALYSQSTQPVVNALSMSDTVEDVKIGKAFYDINFDSKYQAGEPFADLDSTGAYEIELSGDNAKCEGYAPLVVEVYPVLDETDTIVVDGYKMTIAPTEAKTTNDLIAISPLTSIVWDEIQKEVSLMPSVKTCSDLVNNQELYNEIENDIVQQESRVARTYNVTVDDMYSDYKESGDSSLALLSESLVIPMKKSYVESETIQEDSNSEISYVYYYSALMSSEVANIERAINILKELEPSVIVPDDNDSLSRTQNAENQLAAFDHLGTSYLMSNTWLKEDYYYNEDKESFDLKVYQLDESFDTVKVIDLSLQSVIRSSFDVEEKSLTGSFSFDIGNHFNCNYSVTSEKGRDGYLNEAGTSYYELMDTSSDKKIGSNLNECGEVTKTSESFELDSSSWTDVLLISTKGLKRFESDNGAPIESVSFDFQGDSSGIIVDEADLVIDSATTNDANTIMRTDIDYTKDNESVKVYSVYRLTTKQESGNYKEFWSSTEEYHNGTSKEECAIMEWNETNVNVPTEADYDSSNC